jgi:hypothetical protein
MPAHRTIRRSAAAFAVATAAVVAVLTAAAPALAADNSVQVSMSGLSSNQTAGARPDGFQVRLTSKLRQSQVTDLHIAFDVQMNGLQPDFVTITRGNFPMSETTNGADVIFTDPEPLVLLPTRSITRNYNISFSAQTPEGGGQLTAIAFVGQAQVGSDSAGFSVHGGNGQPTPTPSHSASPPPTVPVPEPTSTISLAPIGGGGQTTPLASTSGVPIFIYVMGGILVALGAVILYVLFRSPRDPRDPVPAAGYPPPGPTYPPIDYPPRADAPTMYGPRQNTPTATMPVVRDHPTGPVSRTMHDRPTAQFPAAPTAQLPQVNDPRSPGPGVDPWAHAE